ncbi:MAG: hypothetical protein WCB36_08795, partial [Burkholderiales bacterium]
LPFNEDKLTMSMPASGKLNCGAGCPISNMGHSFSFDGILAYFNRCRKKYGRNPTGQIETVQWLTIAKSMPGTTKQFPL